ncbi:glucosaminidase domain-containing protein [Alphaproteobacteria bacterium]|nr:glucosaminidase domain-containing protein [Alphaproteobacteria bacterium]
MHKSINFFIIFSILLIFFGSNFNAAELKKNDFISSSLNKNIIYFDSKAINQKYSQKVILNQDDFSLIKSNKKKLKLRFNKNNILAKKKSNSYKDNTLDSFGAIASDWENSFSNKKSNFIKILLPLIAFENQKILLERKKLNKIKNILKLEKTLSNDDIDYLLTISKKYNIKNKKIHKIDVVNKLLLNVDIIPNSIVLAQAANESGWGTSRFAKEYNALFGQYTYDKNKGIIPFERAEGKKHLIKNFSSINKSVESYFKNINSHYAYEEFRKIRQEIKNQDLKYNIKKLTYSLRVYAEDKSYVNTLNSIIDSNNLYQFDYKLNTFTNS